jgi:hypothetical protein
MQAREWAVDRYFQQPGVFKVNHWQLTARMFSVEPLGWRPATSIARYSTSFRWPCDEAGRLGRARHSYSPRLLYHYLSGESQGETLQSSNLQRRSFHTSRLNIRDACFRDAVLDLGLRGPAPVAGVRTGREIRRRIYDR